MFAVFLYIAAVLDNVTKSRSTPELASQCTSTKSETDVLHHKRVECPLGMKEVLLP